MHSSMHIVCLESMVRTLDAILVELARKELSWTFKKNCLRIIGSHTLLCIQRTTQNYLSSNPSISTVSLPH